MPSPKCQFCGDPAGAQRGKYLRIAGQIACGACHKRSLKDEIKIFLDSLWKRARVGRTRKPHAKV